MKTAEEWVAEIFLAKRSSHEYEKIVRQIQSEVREEAARGLEVVGDQHVGNDVCDDFVRILLPKLAAAIRKMELP